MDASSPVMPAPGGLEFVRQFVNTLDIEAGTDRLADPGTTHEWALEHDIGLSLTGTDLTGLRELREALRAALLANHEQELLPARTVDALNTASAHTPLVMRFTPDGSHLLAGVTGVHLLHGRLITAITQAMTDNTWQRLKACTSDSCQWGFYDTSRSRTGRWCSMSICGNRAKQARYRGTTTAVRRDQAQSNDTAPR